MTEIIEANFQIEWLTLLQLLFRSVLKYFDFQKTREALAASNQELARTKAELETCQMSKRQMFAVGLVVLLLAIVVARRG